MNGQVISARGLRKAYKNKLALDGASFEVAAGRIVGLIGPNGAGKTTALKAILGLIPFEGELSVLGRDPRTQRDELMNDVCFIADVAVLPRWLRVGEAIEFVAGVHPRFDSERCQRFLANTQLKPGMKVRELSKGMIVQLHLALVMAIDAKLLVLDEPPSASTSSTASSSTSACWRTTSTRTRPSSSLPTRSRRSSTSSPTCCSSATAGWCWMRRWMRSASASLKFWSTPTGSTPRASSSPSTSAPCRSARP